MEHSIPENLQLINSRISWFAVGSLLITAPLIAFFAGYLWATSRAAQKPIVYTEGGKGYTIPDSKPFGAVNSPVYTFAWCQGADKIKASNKVYFKDAEEAERSGRTLSKLCDR